MSRSSNTRWWWCVGLALVLVGAGGVSYIVLKVRAQERAAREAEEQAAREARERQALKELRLQLREFAAKRRACEERLRLTRALMDGLPVPDAQHAQLQ